MVALHARWDRCGHGSSPSDRSDRSGREPLVLLGSLGSDTSMWDRVVPALNATHDVLRVDHRGHGSSPVVPGPCTLDDLVDDLLATLDREGVERAALVGLSLGGMVALAASLRAQERFDRLVVLCTSAHLPPALGWLERADRVLAEGTSSVAADVVSRWFTDGHAAAHPGDVERMRAMIGATDREGYAACCHAIAGMDLVPRLGEVRADVLAVAGVHDRTTPPEHLRTIAAGVPRARAVEVEGAHLAAWECADEVAELVLQHVRAPVGR